MDRNVLTPLTPHTLLITRPKADAEAFCKTLQATQKNRTGNPTIAPIACPMFRIAPINPAPNFDDVRPDAYDAIITTSQHALTHVTLPMAWQNAAADMPSYTVGEKSRAALQALGFRIIHTPESANSNALYRLICSTLPHKNTKLLYLRGAHIHSPLDAELRHAGFTYDSIITYDQPAETTLPDEALAALHDAEECGAAFFSMRSIGLFCTLLTQHKLQSRIATCTAFCASAAIAKKAHALGFRATHTAASPSAEAIKTLILSHYAGMVKHYDKI